MAVKLVIIIIIIIISFLFISIPFNDNNNYCYYYYYSKTISTKKKKKSYAIITKIIKKFNESYKIENKVETFKRRVKLLKTILKIASE